MTASTALDIILVLILVVRAMRGWGRGALVEVAAVIGLVGGVWAGLRLSAIIVRQMADSASWLTTGIVRIALVILIAEITESICAKVAHRARRAAGSAGLARVDALVGAALSTIVTALVMSVGALAISPVLPPSWGDVIDQSVVVTQTDRVVPEAVDRAAGRAVAEVVDGFPRVFSTDTDEPRIPVSAPDSGVTKGAAVRQAAQSVVKIHATSASCGRSSEGSGWVSANHRVVTNAHVVAGSSRVRVQVGGTGAWLRATVVSYDPNLDLAVLAVPQLSAKPLTMATKAPVGESTVVAGYPLDGSYTAGAARIRGYVTASGHNIYGTSTVRRTVLSVRGTVLPGNSGGPLLTSSGQVAGTIFARSTAEPQTGYALANDETSHAIRAAATDTTAASTGACIVER